MSAFVALDPPWVFFYNSRAYVETGSFSDALTGNGPIVVECRNGRIHELTTARPIDVQVEELAAGSKRTELET